MEMERLTNKTSAGLYACENCKNADVCTFCRHIDNAIAKLAHYEDLEEQGRLVVLPCKIGDRVYRVCHQSDQPYGCCSCSQVYPGDTTEDCAYFIDEGCTAPFNEISENIYSVRFSYELLREVGRSVFLTREAAESALTVIREGGE